MFDVPFLTEMGPFKIKKPPRGRENPLGAWLKVDSWKPTLISSSKGWEVRFSVDLRSVLVDD